MRILIAILLGFGLLVCQIPHGGALVPFLMVPAMGFVLAALLIAFPAQFAGPPAALPVVGSGLIFVAYVLWRCAVAEDADLARIDAGQFLLYAGVWLATALAMTGRTAPMVLLAAIFAATVVEGALAVYQATRSDESPIPVWFAEELRLQYMGRFHNRARGFFLNPNQLAWVTNVAALLALGLGVWGRISAIWRIAFLYLACVFAALTVLSVSRGGFLSLAIGLVVFCGVSLLAILLSVRRGRVWLIVAGIGCVMVFLAAGAFTFSNSWVARGRVDTLLTPGIRTALNEHALRMFEREPVIGTGPGTFVYEARLYRTQGQNRDAIFAHNDWLQFLAEYGFSGLALGAIFLIFVVIHGLRGSFQAIRDAVEQRERPFTNRGGILIGALAALGACLAHGVTDFNLHIPANGILLAMVTGLLSVGASPSRGMWVIAGRGVASVALAVILVLLFGYVFRFAGSDYYGLLATNALKRGDPALAIKLGNIGLDLRPRDPRLNATFGRANFEYESSLQFLNYGVETDLIIDEEEESDGGEFADEEVIQELSEEERQEFFGRAAGAFAVAMEEQPRERSHAVEAAAAELEIGNSDRAIQFSRRAIVLDPMHGYTWGSYGGILTELGRDLDALKVLEVGSVVNASETNLLGVEALREELELAPEEVEE